MSDKTKTKAELLEMLAEEARRAGIVQPSTLNTPYVNTIPPEREERADWDRDIEHREVCHIHLPTGAGDDREARVLDDRLEPQRPLPRHRVVVLRQREPDLHARRRHRARLPMSGPALR